MSYTFILNGKSSVLSYDFSPPLYLNDEFEYEIGLTNFDSYNTIPNINETNNCFEWHNGHSFFVKIPEGSYELDNLARYIETELRLKDPEAFIRISTDNITTKVILRSNRVINFNVENSLASVLGFEKKILKPNIIYTSSHPVKIIKVNTILIECNIALGSFLNSSPVHYIHQFFPEVPFGYKIVETPSNIIYFPINTKTINNISVRVLDQDGDLVSFPGETITIRLHLRKIIP